MTTISADDIRVLAQSNHEDPALAVVEGEVQVVPSAQEAGGHLVYTKRELVTEYGDEITDIQAEVLAAGLTAQLAPAETTPEPAAYADPGTAPASVDVE